MTQLFEEASSNEFEQVDDLKRQFLIKYEEAKGQYLPRVIGCYMDKNTDENVPALNPTVFKLKDPEYKKQISEMSVRPESESSSSSISEDFIISEPIEVASRDNVFANRVINRHDIVYRDGLEDLMIEFSLESYQENH